MDVTTLIGTIGRRSQVVNGHVQPWQPISTDLYVLSRTVSGLFVPTDQQLFQKAFPLTAGLAPPLSAQDQARFSPLKDLEAPV